MKRVLSMILSQARQDFRARPTLWLSLLVATLMACGVASAQTVSVTISPTVATLATLATQSFTATVTGTTNTAVSWQVNGVAGGNAAAGLISTTIPGTAGEGLYLGPTSVPSPASVTVTAVSQADPTKSASATVTIEMPSRAGVTFYVATTGNDNNAGTLSAP